MIDKEKELELYKYLTAEWQRHAKEERTLTTYLTCVVIVLSLLLAISFSGILR